MRPSKAYRIIYNAIDKCLYKGQPIGMDIIPAVDKLLERCINSLNHIDDKYGFERTPYIKEELENSYDVSPNNLGDLSYISDRFNAPHRLYWLRNMVVKGMFTGGITLNDYWKEDK